MTDDKYTPEFQAALKEQRDKYLETVDRENAYAYRTATGTEYLEVDDVVYRYGQDQGLEIVGSISGNASERRLSNLKNDPKFMEYFDPSIELGNLIMSYSESNKDFFRSTPVSHIVRLSNDELEGLTIKEKRRALYKALDTETLLRSNKKSE